MLALVWDGKEPRVRSDVPPPAASSDAAVVRVHLAGICSTDLEILSGYMSFRGVLGHEFVGEVIDGPPDRIGQRVVGEINFACGRCDACAAGRRRHCPSRSVMGILGADGAFAEQVRVPIDNLHSIPDRLSDEEAVFVEPTAAALQAGRQTEHLSGGRSLVLGAGKLGLLVAQVLRARGDTVGVVARRPAALELAERLGLKGIEAGKGDRTWDLVVDATGHPGGLEIALRAVRPLGTVVMKSTVATAHQVHLAPLVIDEVTVIGSRCGEFSPAIEALAAREVDVRPLIEARYSLAEAPEAISRARAPGALKVLLAC